MASLFRGSEGSTTAAPQSHQSAPQIAFPAPTSQPNANRIFFVPDYVIGGSSRRPRHSVSVPQLPKSQTGSTKLHKSPLSTPKEYASENNDIEQASSSSKPQFSSQFGKLKLKLPYNLARQRLNKFINKNFIPSFLYGSEPSSFSSTENKPSDTSSDNHNSNDIINSASPSGVVSESFAVSPVQQGSVEMQHSLFENNGASQQHIPHSVHPSQSAPNLSFYAQAPPFLSIPAETASVSSLRASRSRQGSVSTHITNNDANLSTANLSMTDGYLGIPNSSTNDVSSLYDPSGLVRQQSVTSSASASSSYYTQQYQMHPHMQQQLLHKRSFLSDSESIFFSSKESSTSASKSDQKTDLVKYFPREIIDQIFIILDIKSLNACALVNKNWQSIANANAVWRAKYFQQPYWNTISGYLPEETKEHIHKTKKVPPLTWKYVYQTRAKLEERWRNGDVEPKALKGHTDSVYCVHFNDKIIVTGSRDQTIKIWNAKSGALIRTLGGDNHGQDQHPDNDEEDENIDIEQHETVAVDNQPLFGSTTAFSTPSTASAEITTSSSSSSDTSDNSDLIRHQKSVLCLYFDDELMVSGSSDSSIILWKLPEFVAFKKIQEHDSGILDVTLDERYICSCSRDSSICVWYRPKPAPGSNRFDETTKVELKVRLRGHRSPVNSIHLRGDNIFSAGGDGIVRMWSIEQAVCLREFSGHKRGLACIQVSADGKTLVSGSNDKQIRVWEIETGKCVRILEGHTALVRSLDICSGKIISGSYDQTLKLWDLDTGALIHDMDKYFGSWIFSAKANCKRIVCTSFGIKPIILDFGTGLDERCLDFISA